MSELNDYGFIWDQVEVERSSILSTGYKILSIKIENKTKLSIYISPTGRSIRVFKGQ